MNQHKLEVIKQEFGDDLTTPLEGWRSVTSVTSTPMSRSLSTASQSVSNQFAPTTSNDPSTSTFRSPMSTNVNMTYASVASVRVQPTNARLGLVKMLERNSNRPFSAARYSKFVPVGSQLLQNNNKLPFNLELKFKQTQEQLKELTEKFVENRNAYETLEMKYDDLKLDYGNAYSKLENKYDQLKLDHFELKSNANVKFVQLDTLQMDNDKLKDELIQLKRHLVTLMARINAQTETSLPSAQIGINEEIVDAEMQIKQEFFDDDSEHSSLSNATEMQIKQEFDDDDDLCNQASNILPHDQLNSNNNSVSQYTIAQVNENVCTNGQIDVTNKVTDESGPQIVMDANVEQQSTQVLQSNDTQANMNEVVNGENGLGDEEEQNGDLNEEEEMSNKDRSAVESNEPSTSAQQQSTRTVSTQTSVCNRSVEWIEREQSHRPVKKAKLDTTQADIEGAQDQQVITVRVQCLHSGCSQMFAECELNQHMSKQHLIGHFRCVLKDCTQSFNNKISLGDHLKQAHDRITEWQCGKCSKYFSSYSLLSMHNIKLHQLGQFQCSFPECTFTGEYKAKVYNHYTQHKPTLSCQHADCTYRTSNPYHFKQHQQVHSGIKPYRCKWPDCDFARARKDHTIRHIRAKHLEGTQLDPKDYVEVVQ